MSIINKLQAELSAKKQKNSNLTSFEDIIVVYLGAEKKAYFPKLKDNQGNSIKDEKGIDKRSLISSGTLHTFNQVGTSKIVKVVLSGQYDLPLLSLWKVGGLGYDLKQSSMIFIQESGVLKKYE